MEKGRARDATGAPRQVLLHLRCCGSRRLPRHAAREGWKGYLTSQSFSQVPRPSNCCRFPSGDHPGGLRAVLRGATGAPTFSHVLGTARRSATMPAHCCGACCTRQLRRDMHIPPHHLLGAKAGRTELRVRSRAALAVSGRYAGNAGAGAGLPQPVPGARPKPTLAGGYATAPPPRQQQPQQQQPWQQPLQGELPAAQQPPQRRQQPQPQPRPQQQLALTPAPRPPRGALAFGDDRAFFSRSQLMDKSVITR